MTKAKDTVIKSLTQIPDSLKDATLLEAQADISFKMGMLEVLKSMRGHRLYEKVKGRSYHTGGVSTDNYEMLELRDWWKDFLKEHGLK